MKKLIVAVLVTGGLAAGVGTGTALAVPPNPIFPTLVTTAARAETVPPNPIAPFANRGAYVSRVATSCNTAHPTDPFCSAIVIDD